MGVREEFDSLRKRLLHDSPNLTMVRAFSKLIAEETRLRSMSVASMSVSHSVLAASQKFSTPKGTSSDPCKHCGKTGHSPENCFPQYLEKLAEFRACRAARTGRGRGASFHVILDQSQLVGCKAVTEGTSIQTADGSSNKDCGWDWPSP
ncbi:uncharacterized protein LOC101770312 isoform X4 [Setaria italica]|uniref:uncharacterized protein LOC101770312 isoform X4 n=1 Tax=Setaria italica TaxID=4555 RepID=UPI000BE5804B|nr:uncharacterized protein LOC101770312 isoform X4 [Setaria italica]